MDQSHLRTLPHELLEAIVVHLPPIDTLAFSTTCRTANKITYEPIVWRRHCVDDWRYWEPSHELKSKLENPPAQTRWRLLYEERHKTDRHALKTFNELLLSQQYRLQRIEQIAQSGYDVKDLMLKLRDETPDEAEDVLARRYYANVILGRIHRLTALEKWSLLQKREAVRLEEVLGAYDLFVLTGARGDLNDIDLELDRIAATIRARDPDFETLSTRNKAIQVAQYLQSENRVGNPNVQDFHALRNNFIGFALLRPPHSSLPLQSVAIYCGVAQRLGINARPSNYPGHVHAVIEAPSGETLDGALTSSNNHSGDAPELLETMHMDPWRSSSEVPHSQLTLRLSQMGAPPTQLMAHMRATSSLEMALRTGRNIMNSVQEARDLPRGDAYRSANPDIENAWYSMLWSMMVLGDSTDDATLHRRKQCLPYLVEHHQAHFPEDIGLLENIVGPMFVGQSEHDMIMRLVSYTRNDDQEKKTPNLRPQSEDVVAFKVGTHFKHKRYGYDGIIVGWDVSCAAESRWIRQMRVDELPSGREQPFYNVVAEDKSIRYVAQENIVLKADEPPSQTLMALAGRYFKRWNTAAGVFESNIKDEYPDD